MIVHWNDETIICDKAVKNPTSIEIYDAHDNLIQTIEPISVKEWDKISLEGGTWTEKFDILTDNDKLRADIDYCMMLLEDL